MILGRGILGLDPCELGAIQAAMVATLVAGLAAKCAIDVACWDILGQVAGLPLVSLLGGLRQERVPVWESVPLIDPEAAAVQVKTAWAGGVRVFQVKVGDDPYRDVDRIAAVMDGLDRDTIVIADANGGWSLQAALMATRALAGLRIMLEQPCKSMHDCARVRQHTDLPMIVDECIGGLGDLVFARGGVAGGLNVKPSRLGGLTPARLLRDAATELGMMVTIDDSWGGALTTLALSHLAASTKPEGLLATTFFTGLTMPSITQAPHRGSDGRGAAPMMPGLGCAVDESLLGDAILQIA